MSLQSVQSTKPASDKQASVSPNECRTVAGSVKDVIRYAKGKVSRPQFDQAMRHYDNHLLSSQTARDVERLAEHTVNLIRRGVSFERATLWVSVLLGGVKEMIGAPLLSPLSLRELHRAEEVVEGALDVAECDFIADPTNKAKAVVYLDCRAQYLAASARIEEHALRVAGR